MELSSTLVMWVGFILASYSVVGNDVIQTLGTFLTSNEKTQRWYILWGFAASIMLATLFYGWYTGDIAYGRLSKFTMPETYPWYYLLPPLVLLSITRLGIPVSTTFMILTLFSLQDIPGDLNEMTASLFDTKTKLGGMIQKSIMGYIIAFFAGLIIYLGITRLTEKYFIENDLSDRWRPFWVAAQWCSTAFLWSQWLTQDLANIYIYLQGGNNLGPGGFAMSIVILLGLLAYIFIRLSRRYVMFIAVNKFNPGFLSHRTVHRVFDVPWNHGDVDFMSPFKVRRFLAEQGLSIVRTGVVDTPPYPDSLGFRDMKLHRMNVDLNKIDWDSRTIHWMKAGQYPLKIKLLYAAEWLPLPFLIKLFYAHLFYVLAERSGP